MSNTCIYGGFVCGVKGSTIATAAVNLIAKSQAEAVGLALAYARHHYPTDDGWYNQTADVGMLTEKMLSDSAKLRQELKDEYWKESE